MDFVFAREEELSLLRDRLRRRKNLLLAGPAGVGKTLLMNTVIGEFSQFLYCSDSSTIQVVFRSIASALWSREDQKLRASCGHAGLDALKKKSGSNTKGIVMDALHAGSYCLVLDHVKGPSYAFAAGVREIVGWGGTPVVAIGRSVHMEDIGFLQGIFPDRTDRMEVRNFKPDVAANFAREISTRLGLQAENLDEFLEQTITSTAGNPRGILAMVRMAATPKYRLDERIKITPLYIDYRLSTIGDSARHS